MKRQSGIWTHRKLDRWLGATLILLVIVTFIWWSMRTKDRRLETLLVDLGASNVTLPSGDREYNFPIENADLLSLQ